MKNYVKPEVKVIKIESKDVLNIGLSTVYTEDNYA